MRHPARWLRNLILGCGTFAVGCSESTPVPVATPGEVETAQAPTLAPLPLGEVEAALGSEQPNAIARSRDAIQLALRTGSPAEKLAAMRLALHPQAQLMAAVVPLLSDATVEVRRAAVLVVGPAHEHMEAVPAETLFPCLHDADTEVRALATSALKSRGLDAMQMELARKFSSPNTRDRLQLLLDLALEVEAVPDPGPWLDRLSRDPDPAIRAATARVAFERKLSYTAWLDRLAESDPDATVRRLATWYRQRCTPVQAAGYVEK